MDSQGGKNKKRLHFHFLQIHPFNSIFTQPIKYILIEMSFVGVVLLGYRYFLSYHYHEKRH